MLLERSECMQARCVGKLDVRAFLEQGCFAITE